MNFKAYSTFQCITEHRKSQSDQVCGNEFSNPDQVRLTDSTEKNLKMRVDAEFGATEGKTMLAKKAKELGLDAIHDTVHEMARDEARHGKAFKGLLERYFGK